MILKLTSMPHGFIKVLKSGNDETKIVTQAIAFRPDKLFANSVNDSVELEMMHNNINCTSPLEFKPKEEYPLITQKLFNLLETI